MTLKAHTRLAKSLIMYEELISKLVCENDSQLKDKVYKNTKYVMKFQLASET